MNKFKNKYDVVFYYPQHFNRSSKGTNPFFDPLIKLCEEDKLNYILLEEPDKKTKLPRNKEAIKFDFWMYVVISLRKIFSLIFFDKTRCYDQLIGRILNFLTLYKFSSTIYITISNSMITVLSGFSKNSCVYDLQHGIIPCNHEGYFDDDGKLRKQLRIDNIGFLLYGKGFADVFLKKDEFSSISRRNKIKIVGNLLEKRDENKDHFLKNKVVFSLQMNDDFSYDDLMKKKKELQSFIELNKELFVNNKISLLLKHHPRFNDIINLDDILNKYSFVSTTSNSISELIPFVFLHITESSSCVFDFAINGIPSVIIPNNYGIKIFVDEFKYPFPFIDLEKLITEYVNNNEKYSIYCLKVKEWVAIFYEPFNNDILLSLLKKKSII